MKVREHLDKIVEGNTVDRLWELLKTPERRELKLREQPGMILEPFRDRVNGDRTGRSMLF